MISRYRDGALPPVATDSALASDFDALPEQVAALLDRAEATQALELIWQRVRRLNRYVEEKAPWKLAKAQDAAGELDQTLASLAEGLRAVSVLLHPYMPATTRHLLGALGVSDFGFDGAAFAARCGVASVSAIEPLFPKRS